MLVLAFAFIIRNKSLANENLINEFLQEQNENVDYFYETGQISEKKEYETLEEIYNDFVKLNGNVFESFKDYKAFCIESMIAKHEIEETIDDDNLLQPSSVINKSKFYTGDIVVTNATSSFGLTGHAGFVIDNNLVLTANKKRYCPFVEKFENWIKQARDEGGWIQIIRPKDKALSTHRHIAKTWALNKYTINKNGEPVGRTDIIYRITPELQLTNPTYCSKIPFQAYKFGAKIGHDLPSKNTIIIPYKLKDYFNDNPTSQFEHSIKNYY